MENAGSFIAGAGFMISVSLMAVALALVYIGLQLKEQNRIHREKSK